MEERREKMRIGLSVLLVLALASFANATLSWDLVPTSVDTGIAVVITVSSDTGGMAQYNYGVWIGVPGVSTNAVLQNANMLTAAGPDRNITSYSAPYDNGDDYQAKKQGPNPITTGDWSTVQFVSSVLGTYTVNLYDYTANGGDYLSPGTAALSVSLDVVPEPATIALLGLGGLFLTRRRRRG